MFIRCALFSRLAGDAIARAIFRAALIGFLFGGTIGRSGTIPSVGPDLIESGVPSFVVLGPESLGLSTAPTDLHLLPDGRLLVVAQREISFGDGVRWQTFQSSNDRNSVINDKVAVAADGQIYVGIEGNIARLTFAADGRWSLLPVTPLPDSIGLGSTFLKTVIMLPDNWYWHSGTGGIVTWMPGRVPQVVGKVGSIEHVFGHGNAVFVSSTAAGELFQFDPSTKAALQISPPDALVNDGITCAIPFSPGLVLTGTRRNGLQLFDGTFSHPFKTGKLLGPGHRINALCPINDQMFAAAVETVGIILFDRHGRTVQVLDSGQDHRLARVKILKYAPSGVLWAVLDEGLARMEFPSPVSHYEALLQSGIDYARPMRYEGRLWVTCDGRALRAVYDGEGRLVHFEDDSPPGEFISNLAVIDGSLWATNNAGIFRKGPTAWELIITGIRNAHLDVAQRRPRGILYTAIGELGWIRRNGDHFDVERFVEPQLKETFNGYEDDKGIVWLELGMSKVGRIDLSGERPALKIFGPESGLSLGWAGAYIWGGAVRISINSDHLRFDDATQRFVPDSELLKIAPELGPSAGAGRPGRDGLGRVWYSSKGRAYFVNPSKEGTLSPIRLPFDYEPNEFTMEEGGVVWTWAKQHFSRYDPAIPQIKRATVKAGITLIQFTASKRHLFAPGAALQAIDYADNSFVVHFGAPTNPFGSRVTFEVMLEGSNAQWTSTGSVGSAAFNDLKEGNYVFHVRPVSNSVVGTEAVLAFTVRPPWFRTPLAWTLYIVSALGLLAFMIWVPAFLQRRENERLERLVIIRTKETTEKSAALTVSEERFRVLNAELDQRVQLRTAELSRSHEELQQRELLFRLIFEHAPVGISWKRADLGTDYHFNSTFARILGLPAVILPDYSLLTAMIHPEDAPRQDALNRLLASGQKSNYTVEHRYVRKDGAVVWGLLAVAVIRDASGSIIQDIGILEDITARKKAEQELAVTYQNLVEVSRTAGMAEVATGVLHNVGNVLNSLNVSSTVLAAGLRQSKVGTLVKLAEMLNEHAADLATFLTQDPKGRNVPAFITSFAKHSLEERDRLLVEAASLQENVDHIKEIVSMQQSFATMVSVIEPLDPVELMEHSLRMNLTALDRHGAKIERDFHPVPRILAEKAKVIQILLNLITNAKKACDEGGRTDKLVTLRIVPVMTAGSEKVDRVQLIVSDNGVGVPAENLTKIFAHGFTTRASGHGFGLHSAANAAKEMKGSVNVESAGPGQGASFILELPAQTEGEPLPRATERNQKAGTV